MNKRPISLILGGGVTGLAAGVSSGLPIYESRSEPGGICSSYYVKAGNSNKVLGHKHRHRAYRFEYGGGHWIFGGDPAVIAYIKRMVDTKSYERNSAVYLARVDRFVPFPIQYFLNHLAPEIASQALQEMTACRGENVSIMRDWLYDRFGKTLCDLFFGPFHERYTGGLWTEISPQDDYKSPIRIDEVLKGMRGEPVSAGYNVKFLYPVNGLSAFAGELAKRTTIHYGKEVTRIDIQEKVVEFRDGTRVRYDRIISTLPLCKMPQLTGIEDGPVDSYTSVLVINIGAVKGKRCPPHHWLYVPDSKTGFHRVGFYSNVDPSFLPHADARPGGHDDRVSIYVEFAFRGGTMPDSEEISALAKRTIEELKAWQFIDEVEVLHPTWIDVAYTWAVPGSQWKQKMIPLLESHGIYQVGRYGRWIFQGIADSIRDGLMVGATFR